MRSIILTLLLFSSFAAFSQIENPKRNSSLKIYNLTTVERDYAPMFPDSLSSGYSENFYNVQLFHPTFAFQWYNAKGNAHEIELTGFRLSNSETNGWSSSSRQPSISTHPRYAHTGALVSLRYEYILFVKREGAPRLTPSLGLGVNPYYKFDIYRSSITTVFPEQYQAAGVRFFAIPRLNYSLSDRLYLDLNFPVAIHDAKVVSAKHEDPTIPINDRRRTSFETESFSPLFSARFGVGIRL